MAVHPPPAEPRGAGGGADRRRAGRASGPGYRGPDRRRLSAAVTQSEDRFFRVAVVVVVAMGAAATIAGFWDFSAGSDMAQRVDTILDHASAVLGAVAAVVMLLGSRLRSQTRPAALALVVLLLFAVHPVLSHLGWLVPISPTALVWVDTATVVVGLGLLVVQLGLAPVDTRYRPARMALGTALALVVVAVVLQAGFGATTWPGLGPWPTLGPHAVWPTALKGGVEVVLAVSFLVRGPERSVAIDRWFGIALGTWGWAGLVSSAGEGSARAALSDAVLHLLGMAFLVCGVLVEMAAWLLREGDAFFAAQVGERAGTARERVLRREARDRDHEVRSALIALRNAIGALSDQSGRLGEGQRRALADIIRAGLRDLESHALAPSEEAVPMAMAELCRAVPRWAADVGVRLGLDLPAHLVVRARPRVVEEALEVMWRSVAVPGTALVLGAARAGDRAVLCFRPAADGFPTTAADDGGRSAALVWPAPSRIGAVASVELAALRGMLCGDDAALEEAPTPKGRGLVLRLPLAPCPPEPGGLVDAGHDGLERAQDQADGAPVGTPRRGPSRAAGPARQHHRHLGPAPGGHGPGDDGQVVDGPVPVGSRSAPVDQVDHQPGAGRQTVDDVPQ